METQVRAASSQLVCPPFPCWLPTKRIVDGWLASWVALRGSWTIPAKAHASFVAIGYGMADGAWRAIFAGRDGTNRGLRVPVLVCDGHTAHTAVMVLVAGAASLERPAACFQLVQLDTKVLVPAPGRSLYLYWY